MNRTRYFYSPGIALLMMLWASGLSAQPAWSARVEVPLVYGIKAYNHGRLDEAERLFRQALESDPQSGTAHYWLGRTRLRLGDTKAAISQFELSLRAERPASIARAHLLSELGAAHLQAGHPTAASRVLKESLDLRPRDSRTQYLYDLAQESERRPQAAIQAVNGDLVAPGHLPTWELRLSGDYGYDSNPSALPDGVRAFDSGSPDERIDGSDSVATGTVRLEVHPFYDKKGWSLGLRADGFRSLNEDLNVFDLSRVGGVVQLAYGKDPLGYLTGPLGYTRVPRGNGRFALLLQAGSDYSYLDEDSFQRTWEGAASVVLRQGERFASQLELDYRDITHFDHDLYADLSGLSGHEAYARLSQYLFLGRRDRHLRVSARVGESDRDDRTRDSTFVGGAVEFSTPLAKRLYLHSSIGVRHDDFDEDFEEEGHDELLLNSTGSLTWNFAENLYLTARGSYTDRDADPEAIDDTLGFDRTIGALGLTYFH